MTKEAAFAAERREICPACHGRGREKVQVPGGRPIVMSCDTCGGGGKVAAKKGKA